MPESITAILNNDAKMFEVYKKDGRTINRNRFLGKLITGYYDDYVEEERIAYHAIISAIETDKLIDEEKKQITDNIIKTIVHPALSSEKRKHSEKLSLKPTKDTKFLIMQIIDNLGSDDAISQYFCRMITSYCRNSFRKREQIIFKKNYEYLRNACKDNRNIIFNTIWNDQHFYEVVPYCVVTGPEEMFNYLLCAEIIPGTGEQKARAYRLNRIREIKSGKGVKSIDSTIRSYLDRMIRYGPQYEINNEACVRLSSLGIELFNKIYFGRPRYERIEKEGNQNYYYFQCSEDQLFLYFKRFEKDTAEILYPMTLRERILNFHKEVLDAYKK